MSTQWNVNGVETEVELKALHTALLAALHSVILSGRQKPLRSSAPNPSFDLEVGQSNRKSRMPPFAILSVDWTGNQKS